MLTFKTVVTVAWIPFVIYVGYRNSSPQPSLIK
jgi:import receptor subunit TOM7